MEDDRTMGIKSKMTIIQNYLFWKIENKGISSTSLFTVGDRRKIKVGRYSYGRLNVAMWGSEREELRIGEFCSIAPTSRFVLGGGHSLDTFLTFPLKQKFLCTGEAITNGSIVIEDDVWIGDSALIMSGVHIGKGAVVGAGAVVTHDIEPYAIAVGVPAKCVKYRFEQDMIDKLNRIDYSKLTEQIIKNNIELLTKPIKNNQDIEQIANLLAY